MIVFFTRSASFADHVADLRSVFSRLDAAGCTLSVAKCQFGYDEIKCLGHTVNRQGVTVQAGLVDRILTLPAPSNQKELLTFLSLAEPARPESWAQAEEANTISSRVTCKRITRTCV